MGDGVFYQVMKDLNLEEPLEKMELVNASILIDELLTLKSSPKLLFQIRKEVVEKEIEEIKLNPPSQNIIESMEKSLERFKRKLKSKER